MIKLSQRETKSLVNLHGWSAIFTGLLLYAVVVTGTVAVLAEEILHWSIGEVRHENPLESGIDATVREFAAKVDKKYLEEVSLGHTSEGYLSIFYHTHQKNEKGQLEDYGTRFEIDTSTNQVVEEKTGSGAELFQNDNPAALSRFFVSIHTELHLPRPWGMLLTGILGLAMMVAAVSGFLMHRHLFTDMFVLRRNKNKVLEQRDLHTVAGTWGLPFAFILAFTGSFFSFAGSFGLPVMAMVAFGGDEEALIRTVMGAPASQSESKKEVANIDVMIQDVYRRTKQYPEFAVISHNGKDDSKILFNVNKDEKKLGNIQYEYAAPSGEFLQQKPSIGTKPSLGSASLDLIGPLHFGNFSGLLSKFVWVALGFASCYVIITGFGLWMARRRETERWHLFERIVIVFAAGIPMSMLICCLAYYISPMFGLAQSTSVPMSFVISAVVSIAWGLLAKNCYQVKMALYSCCFILCLMMPLIRLLSGGISWGAALGIHNFSVVMIDILLVMCAAFSLYLLKGLSRPETSPIEKLNEPQAA